MKSTALPQDAALDLLSRVAEEFTEQLERGEQPDIESFAARFPDAAESIRQMLEALLAVHALTPDSDAARDSEDLASPIRGHLGDYRIIREVGRGGMGVVYEAEQVSLGRRVALKVLPFAAMLDSTQLQRFNNEAHAGAQLHHTNIVPVFGVGCERGVHYYVMQFIEGSTLGDVIHELRQLEHPDAPHEFPSTTRRADSWRPTVEDGGDSGGTTPKRDVARFAESTSATSGSSAALDIIAPEHSTRSPAFFRAVANLGVQAAEALAHAHELGVVHRDIKPSNMLLDTRGNLWITDFGLARLESDASLTMTGDVLGTLRYMSPEQAAGKHLLLDHRTDIYSLGATLYELLTLEPAFDGRDRQELMRKIAEQDPRQPRRLNGAIPADLETIVLKATAKEPQGRYASAKALTEDLHRFLRDKPIRAKRPTLMERAAKWSRRHRHLVASAVVVLMLAVVGLTVGMLLVTQKQAEIVRQRNAARVQSTRAEAARGRERQQRELAEKREEQTQQVSDFQAAMLSEIDVEAMGRGIKERFREQVRAALERQYVGEFPDRRKRTTEEIESELAAFDQRASAAQAVDVARGVMDEYVLAQAADALETEFADQPLVRAQLHNAIGATYRELGLYSAAAPHLRTALEIRRRELGDDHTDTLSSIDSMGVLLWWAQDKLAEAEPYVREALEGRQRVLGDEHPDTLISIDNMGGVLQAQGKLAEAERYRLKALEGFRRVLGDEHPYTLISINNMGGLLQQQGKLAEAEPYLREALEGSRRVLGDEHPRTLGSINNMGGLLYLQGKLAEAEPYLREALEGRRRVLGDEHPRTLISINNMGGLLQQQGRLAEAEPYFREALETSRRVLGDEHPITLTSINGMGVLLEAQGELAEAEPYFREALEGRRRVLGDEHPRTLQLLEKTSQCLAAQGKLEDALTLCRDFIEHLRSKVPDGDAALGAATGSFGQLLVEQQEYEEAEPLLRECLQIRENTLDPDSVHHWLIAQTRSLLGCALVGRGAAAASSNPRQAIELFTEAEPLILDGYEWLSMNFEQIDPSLARELRIKRVNEAGERIVWLYETWHAAEPDAGHDVRAAEWRAELDNLPGP